MLMCAYTDIASVNTFPCIREARRLVQERQPSRIQALDSNCKGFEARLGGYDNLRRVIAESADGDDE